MDTLRFHEPVGASQMALTLCFREPVGASPGPDFVGWTLCDFVNQMGAGQLVLTFSLRLY